MHSRLKYSPARAILFISIGTGFMAAADICMKYLAGSHSLPSILWLRNLMILAVIPLCATQRAQPAFDTFA